ncbi:GAF and ANTAR domain-containing protein [Nocardioides hwasunensis]|uniref:GAF and ANTAR domain-containing protein n=2 Tax=Nocardioides hwasunensis TaxID=397258 RepID=A0ABR8MFQ9_9ACTN|nr:GAF and ANTAR domain-containing protein [Nocardioides hwasunensis]
MAARAPGRDAADALCVSCVGLLEVDGVAVSVISGGTSAGTFGSSSAVSRRLDEYHFTFGEGPSLDAVSSRSPVLVPDLGAGSEDRWPAFRDALLEDGIRGVFALPIMITSACVGALDLYRQRPGPLGGEALASAMVAAQLASAPLLDLISGARTVEDSEVDPHADADDDPTPDMDRVEIYQASGMLMPALGVSADEAMLRLRAHALATSQSASQVARAIIERRLVLERDDAHWPHDTNGSHHSQPDPERGSP